MWGLHTQEEARLSFAAPIVREGYLRPEIDKGNLPGTYAGLSVGLMEISEPEC